MKLISFYATRDQVLNRTKDVTRRLGWRTAQAGQIAMGVLKARGVAVQDRECLAMIQIVKVGRERLDTINQAEVAREGFPDWTPAQFVEMFCRLNHCDPTRAVTRLEFRYLTPATGETVWVPLITRAAGFGPAVVRHEHPGKRIVEAVRTACRPSSIQRWYDVRQLQQWRDFCTEQGIITEHQEHKTK